MSLMRVVAVCSLLSVMFCFADGKETYPSYGYEAARSHELKPHRRTIPLDGVRDGSHQLRIRLIVSPAGEVVDGEASGDDADLRFWPQLQAEVRRWKFTPFEKNGAAITAEVEEYIDLVPPERLPTRHVQAPELRPDSRVKITLDRSACFGMCPVYTVTVSTEGVTFDGHAYFPAKGMRTDLAQPEEVRALARKFIDADFYSMDDHYEARVTDNPTYTLSISIDGHEKSVVDYVGSWVGMPAVITELEEQVDELAQTERWIRRG